MKRVRSQKDGDDRGQYLLPMSKKRVEGDGKKSRSLPLDLIIEILTKLPPKSVSKLIRVSKLWSSIIKGKHFTDLYLARSSTRPRLLFQFYGDKDTRFFCSASQEDPSSDHRANTNPIRVPAGYVSLPPIRGLICYRTTSNLVICNPSTGQFLTLPKVDIRSKYTLFGYDPVNDLYKVLCMTLGGQPFVTEDHQVFSLGAQKKEWRMIKCKHPHHLPVTQGLYRNGVVYYGARRASNKDESGSLLVSFDFRFEEFGLIALPKNVHIQYYSGLVNYNGKLALVDQSFTTGKFEFWVLEDVIKQEWSKISVLVPSSNDFARRDLYRCRGTISTGELVFSPYPSTTEFFVIYYDPKEDKAKKIEFQIRGDPSFVRMRVFLDHVESPMFLPSNFIVDD